MPRPIHAPAGVVYGTETEGPGQPQMRSISVFFAPYGSQNDRSGKFLNVHDPTQASHKSIKRAQTD
eukprot:scaffold54331_cov17-Prasinocladus_malaysianus.AAC.1